MRKEGVGALELVEARAQHGAGVADARVVAGERLGRVDGRRRVVGVPQRLDLLDRLRVHRVEPPVMVEPLLGLHRLAEERLDSDGGGGTREEASNREGCGRAIRCTDRPQWVLRPASGLDRGAARLSRAYVKRAMRASG
jgi:hypothetical protein